MKYKYYVFLNVDMYKTPDGTRIERLIAVKTTNEFTIVSKFEHSPSQGDYDKAISSLCLELDAWIAVPYQVKFIVFDNEEMQSLVDHLQEMNTRSRLRDYYKNLKHQYWNVKNELCYRIGTYDDLSLEDSLDIYGLSFVGDFENATDRCFNSMTLLNHFIFDNRRNQEIFVKSSQRNQGKNHRLSHMSTRKQFGWGEEMLMQKMAEGWHISIACRSKGVGYGLFFEAIAISPSIDEETNKERTGKGKSLEEVMTQLFPLEFETKLTKSV